MKVYKVVLSIIDFDGVGEDGIREQIEGANYANDCISPAVRSIEARDIGEWHHDHPLNDRGMAAGEFKRLFSSP